MPVTRVNSATITASSTAAVAYSTTVGVAVPVGSLVVVTAHSTGTHVTNGMAFSDSKNGAYTTLLEVDQGGASSHWMQVFYKFTTVAMVTTDTLSLTPYAANTTSSFVVDVFAGTAGTINRAAVGTSTATATTGAQGPLASAPTAGSLVLAHATVSTTTQTPPSPFVKASFTTTTASACIAYVLSADGTSTYGGNWTWGVSATGATLVVAFDAAASASTVPARSRVVGQAVNRSAVY